MFDRLTDRGLKVMGLARQEAMRLNHDWIGTEHILLGLMLEGQGVAAGVLARMALDTQEVSRCVEAVVQEGRPEPTPGGPLPFTPRAKAALELAADEAQRLRHNYIGTEHLLLGLVREGEGVAAQVLGNLGVQLEDVRRDVMEAVGASEQAAGMTATHTTSADVRCRLEGANAPWGPRLHCPYCGAAQFVEPSEAGSSVWACLALKSEKPRLAQAGCKKTFVVFTEQRLSHKAIALAEQPE